MKKFLLMLIPALFLCSCMNKQYAQELYSKAIIEYKNQNFETAISLCNEALKEKSNFYEASFLKGKAFFFSRNFEKAEKEFSNLSNKQKENFDYKLWHLKTLYFLDKNEKAFEQIEKLKSINSEDWRIFYWESLFAKKENQFEKYFASLSSADFLLKDSSHIYKELSLIWMELNMADKYVKYSEKEEVIKK